MVNITWRSVRPERASTGVAYETGSNAAGLVRRGNQTIRAAVRTQGSQRVPFFWECPRSACNEAVWLALDDFDRHSRSGEPILAHGDVSLPAYPLTTRTKE